jgi:hypothetical protein
MMESPGDAGRSEHLLDENGARPCLMQRARSSPRKVLQARSALPVVNPASTSCPIKPSVCPAELGGLEEIDRPSYSNGTYFLVPSMNVCISSGVSRPSLLLSIALKIRS